MPFNPFMPVGDPYMPPGFLDAMRRRQQPQPTFQSVSHRPRSPMEDYRDRGPEIPPAPRAPIDIATPPQPAAASPTSWWENLQKMLQSANAGIDPARMGLQGAFGQQQQQQQPTFRDVSNRPQQPTSQQPTFTSRRPQQPTLRPPTSPSVTQPTFGSISHRPKPMSPFYEDIPRPPTGGP